MAVRLLALGAGRPLPPRKIPGILISVRCWVESRAIERLEELGHIEKYNDLIGNQIHGLPVYSIVPQSTTLYLPSRSEYFISFTFIIQILLINQMLSSFNHTKNISGMNEVFR
jgi:hypothetical protein